MILVFIYIGNILHHKYWKLESVNLSVLFDRRFFVNIGYVINIILG